MTIFERRKRQRAYSASPQGKAVRAAYEASPARKAARKKYRDSPAFKAYQTRYSAAYYLIVTRARRKREARP
jgi:hypothetical protein